VSNTIVDVSKSIETSLFAIFAFVLLSIAEFASASRSDRDSDREIFSNSRT